MSFVTTKDGSRIFSKHRGQGQPVISFHGWPLRVDAPNATLHLYEGAPHGLTATRQDRLSADLLALACG